MNPPVTYIAEVRCLFCKCLLGHKTGFHKPNEVTHTIGECCQEFAIKWMSKPRS